MLKKKQKEKRKLHVKLTLGILVKEGLKKKMIAFFIGINVCLKKLTNRLK